MRPRRLSGLSQEIHALTPLSAVTDDAPIDS